jgi:hypothetical protein
LNVRRIVDVGVLATFAAFVALTHARYVVHGQPWGDATMFFHFGRKLLTTGSIPYRDYIFQVGPLPIYVDALCQRLFGPSYVSSLCAGLAVKTLLAWIMYLLATRWVGRLGGVLLAGFLLLDPTFCAQHHWSTPYALLFGLLAILFVVREFQEPRKKGLSLVLAGACVAAIFTARQSGAVAVTAAMAIVTIALAWRCPDEMDRSSLARFWGGYAGALAAFSAVLIAQGAFGATVSQLIVDAPQKKSVLGADVILDVFSGGGLVERAPPFTPLIGFMRFNAVPLVLSTIILLALWRRPRESSGAVLLAMLPVGVILARVTTTLEIGALDDLPRVFGLLTLVIVLATPRTAARMLGIAAPVAAFVLAIPLALEMALEASYHGRGWVDWSSMMALCLLLGLASRRITRTKKVVGCAALALVGVVNASWLAHRDLDPFVKDDMFEGTLTETRFAIDVDVARGMYSDEAKYRVVEWLRDRVHPDDTCFVYGSSAFLYDVLGCRNPTALDITISEFFTAADGERVVRQLALNPPQWIIAAETHWTNPDLTTPPGDDSIYWGGPNGAAAKVLHVGVRRLLDGYEVAGETVEALPPALIPMAERHAEKPHRFRLYRRRT